MCQVGFGALGIIRTLEGQGIENRFDIWEEFLNRNDAEFAVSIAEFAGAKSWGAF
jgi:hypothetical protein